MRDVLEFIKKNTNLNQDDYVVVALSGGPDSMMLLNVLIEYRKEVNFKIVCAHVHHNIRKESDDEAIFVKKYCNDNDLIFEMRKLSYDEKFTESLGHELRYEFFNEIINKYNAKYLFTAHHGDDLIESILMKIVRGASVLGYSGFDSISIKNNYTILRPLITLTKKDILEYLDVNNIPYVIDKSNEDDTYTRNRYRKYILPRLKDEDIDVHLKFLAFSEQLKKYDNYFEKKALEIYSEVVVNNSIIISKITKLDDLIIKKVIYKYLINNIKNINLINKKHVDNVFNMIFSNRPNLVIDIPNCNVIKEYDKISISNGIESFDYEYIFNNEVELPNNRKIIKVDSSELTNNYVTFLNSDNIKLPLIVRNYRHGDKMTIKNMNGHKKIKDIFINEKTDLTVRNGYPVVTDSTGEIIWLPGIKKSSFDSKNSGKYDIILEYR